MVNKIKNYLIIILLCALAVFQITARNKDSQIQKLQVQNLQLNDKLKSVVQIHGNQVQIVYKEGKPGKNTEIIKYINTYIPPESNNTTISTDDNGKVTIDYSKYGAGFYPFIGLGYSDSLRPLVGARLLYWNRYGLGISTGFTGLNVFADVRTDWELFKNSSFGLFYGTDKNLGVSIHTFL